MKKTSVRKKKPADEETLRSEYRFDYSRSKPNRFAAKMSKGTVAVVLEPDVAEIFGSSEVVNDLLRSIIAAIPSSKRDRRANRATWRGGEMVGGNEKGGGKCHQTREARASSQGQDRWFNQSVETNL